MSDLNRSSASSLNQLVEQTLIHMDCLKNQLERHPEKEELKSQFEECQKQLLESYHTLEVLDRYPRDFSIHINPKVSQHLEAIATFLLQCDKVVQEKIGQEVLKTTFWRALEDFRQLIKRLDDTEGENLIRVVKVDQDPLSK